MSTETQQSPIPMKDLLLPLYDSDIYKIKGENGRGDCLGNTQRLIEKIKEDPGLSELVDLNKWSVGFIHWTGPDQAMWKMFPDDSALRTKLIEGESWDYHIFLMDDTYNVYDLSATQELFGESIGRHLTAMFPSHFERESNEISIAFDPALEFDPSADPRDKNRIVELDDIFWRVREDQGSERLDKWHADYIQSINRYAQGRPEFDIDGAMQNIEETYKKRKERKMAEILSGSSH